MKVSVIGATGFVGSAIVKELISRRHEVVAIARHAEKVEGAGKKVSLDVADTDALSQAVSDSDVVVSCFNAGWTNPDLYRENMEGLTNIQKAVEDSGAKRLIVIGGAGSLQVNGKFLVDSPDFPKAFHGGASSMRDYFQNSLRKNTTLDWAYFSPAIEMHQGITTGRTGKYRYGNSSPVFNENGKSILSVEDLAVAIVDEVENQRFHKQQFTAAY